MFISVIAAVLAALWFFSTIQWENWLWGWQLEWFMCVLGTISSLFFLILQNTNNDDKNKKVYFLLAILSGIVASYSLSSGVVAWIVGFFVLIAVKQSKKYKLVWAITGALTIAFYYYHYSIPIHSDNLTLTFFSHHILRFVGFFLAYLSGPIGYGTQNVTTAILAGGALLACFPALIIFVWKDREHLRKYIPWLSIAMLSLLSGLTITIGRLFLGIPEALASRYTTLSVLYIISITILSLIVLEDRQAARRKAIYIASVLIISMFLILSSYKMGDIGLIERSIALQNVKTCTNKSNPSNSCLELTYPIPNVVRPELRFLKENHLAGY